MRRPSSRIGARMGDDRLATTPNFAQKMGYRGRSYAPRPSGIMHEIDTGYAQ